MTPSHPVVRAVAAGGGRGRLRWPAWSIRPRRSRASYRGAWRSYPRYRRSTPPPRRPRSRRSRERPAANSKSIDARRAARCRATGMSPVSWSRMGRPWSQGALDRPAATSLIRVGIPVSPNVAVRRAVTAARQHPAAAGTVRVDLDGLGLRGRKTEVRVLDGDVIAGSVTHEWAEDGPARVTIPWWPIADGPAQAACRGRGHRRRSVVDRQRDRPRRGCPRGPHSGAGV